MPESYNRIESEEELRSFYREPSQIAKNKLLDHLDVHCQKMISLSPFLCLATTSADGSIDISPRGDPPGSVQVLNATQLLIPDRFGNNRVDTLSNLMHNPAIGLFFLVPGMIESLRVSGRARVITDGALLESMAIQDKVPSTGILVDVKRAFLQCGKAVKRSGLWEGTYQIERSEMPSFGAILADQTDSDMSAAELDCSIDDAYKNKLY